MTKMGRPPLLKKDVRKEQFGIRLRPDEARTVREAIRQSGMSQANWLRDALLTKANRGGGSGGGQG